MPDISSEADPAQPCGAASADGRSIRLTKRELEVLRLVNDGKQALEIAHLLFVSKRTVDFHVSNIYDKLQVSNRMQALHRAAKLGLIASDFDSAS